MSSIITGQRISDAHIPITWAALAGVAQLAVVLASVMLFAGDLRARVSGLEQYRESHKVETVHRVEFDRTNQQIDRIEQKLDSLLLELHKR